MEIVNAALNAYASIARPFACIDLDAMDWNISMVNKLAGSKKIRIATKSVRSVELMQYIAERLPNFNGWMTYDCTETLFLLEKGFDHLLLGYPQMERESVLLLLPYIENGSKVVFMVDCEEQWKFLNDIGEKSSVKLEICIDLNMSDDLKWIYFGTRRSSLKSLKDVEMLLQKCNGFSSTELVGVMGYEAQIAGVPDRPNVKWQGPVIRRLKKRSTKKVGAYRKAAVEMIRQTCQTLRFVNGGGSGSLDFTSQAEEVTEVTVGSAFYFPSLFSRYDETPFKPATAFALKVTRKPTDGFIVCHGGGYIASGASGNDKAPVPIWPANLALLRDEGAGEVQTPLADKDRKLQIGDTVFFRHAKAGELCERFTELHARRGERYVKSYKTYRGEGGCFL